MKQALAIIGILLCTVACFGTESHYEGLLNQANNAYSEGQYDSAAVLYETIIGAEWESHDLYYNYGNALFRTGNVPEAILYYEKALKLEPGNRDTQHNLGIANGFIVDRIESIPTPFFVRLFNRLTENISLNMWGVLTLVSLALTLIAAALFYQTGTQSGKKRWFVITVFTGLLLVITVGLGSYRLVQYQANDKAVIMTESVDGYSEPGTTGTKLFVIHAGLTVQPEIIEFDWARIVLPDGTVGWIPADAIARI